MDIVNFPSKLHAPDLDIICIKEIEHGKQFRLVCGAVINIYNSGTVLVQGKLHEHYRERSTVLLKNILPPNTRWCAK